MNTSYEMLESWYETMKGDKELSLKEAKDLVRSIEECNSIKEKELLQEKLLRGTIGVLYSFIKDNGILMLSNTGYVEVEDLLSSLTLAWAEDLQDKISEVGRYSTLFSRDYFESVAEKLGVDISETMACGDTQNDIDILMTAGVGVAMGNATEDVKEIADFISLSNEKDGVAYAIEHFLKGENI